MEPLGNRSKRLPRIIVAAAMAVSVAGCGQAEATEPAESLWGKAFISQRVEASESDETLMSAVEVTISFETDETMSVRADCNTLFGPVKADGGVLKPESGALSSTMMGCRRDSGERDAWLQEFLSGAPRWSLTGATLTLTGADAALVLREDRADG